MIFRWTRRPRPLAWTLLLVLLVFAVMVPFGTSQQTFNEREVKSKQTALDKTNVWSLDFRFKDPRIIKVHVPGRGTRLCWYMWYQVINRTNTPRTFIPDFELVTTDFPGQYHDEVLPSVQREIKKLEDPNNYHNIKNSVTITQKPIPTSKTEDAYPRAVTGVAIWDGSRKIGNNKDLADSIRFTIYISGLSNGWVMVDPALDDPKKLPIIRRKTLQLKFRKIGDRFKLESREIQFVAPPVWMYRSWRLRVPTPNVVKQP